MNLADIASSFLQQFPGGRIDGLQKQERLLERFGMLAFGGFGLVLLTAIGALIYLIITRMILTGVNFWSGILLVAFIVFATLTLYYVLLRESIEEKKKKLNVHRHETEFAATVETPALGEGSFSPAVSVVENTTDLLPVENKTKRFE